MLMRGLLVRCCCQAGQWSERFKTQPQPRDCRSIAKFDTCFHRGGAGGRPMTAAGICAGLDRASRPLYLLQLAQPPKGDEAACSWFKSHTNGISCRTCGVISGARALRVAELRASGQRG